MTDDQLKEFIPKYGDRIALRSFIAKKRKKANKTEKMSLLEKLRLKIKCQHKDDERKDDDVTPSTSTLPSGSLSKNAVKQFRQVEIGLMLYDEKKQNYIQVRSRKGGGVRVIKLSKSSTKAEIIAKAKEVFFNGEKSAFGEENKYECDLMDFQEVILEEGITVSKIVDVTKVQKLRFYLALKQKQNCEHAEVTEQHNVGTSVNTATNSVTSVSSDPPENISETFITQVSNTTVSASLNSDSAKNKGAVATRIPDFSNYYINSIPTNGAGLTTIDEYQSYSTNNVVFEDSLGEVQFLAQEGNYFAQNYAIAGAGPPQPTPELNYAIKLHRGHIFRELREFFGKSMDVSKLNLKVELYLPNGQKEVAEDNGGVMRDALSEFWSSLLHFLFWLPTRTVSMKWDETSHNCK